MKIKNKEEIKEISEKYDSRFLTGDQWQRQDRKESYLHGYSQAQSDLLESASDSFDEWWNTNRFNKHSFDWEEDQEIWQACSIYHAKLIKEKDERIKELETQLESDCETITQGIADEINSQKKYQEAVKDIEFIGYLLEGDSYASIGKALEEWYEEIKSKYGLDKQERKS